MNESLTALATDATLALAVCYLPSPWTLRDATLFSSGRLHVWDQWPTLAESDCAAIATYLRHRPEALADARFFLQQASERLKSGHRFVVAGAPTADLLDQPFVPAPGKPAQRRLAELLEQMAAKRTEDPTKPPDTSRPTPDLLLRDGPRSFAIPKSHAGAAEQPAPLTEVGASPLGLGTRAELLSLANHIEQTRPNGLRYRQVLERLLAALRYGEHQVPAPEHLAVPAGPTQLFVAPTGGGKSVLARVLALHLAQHGTPVALILPDIKEVLKQTHMLENHVRDLGWSLKVVPINSPAGALERAEEMLRDPADYDPQGLWALDRLAYPCRLAAYATEAPPHPGDEPCRRLRQTCGEDEHVVACPFVADCPKFAAFRDALNADILLVNHAAFLMGRVPIRVQTAEGTTARMSVMELVFRRCGAVLIDEIDALQDKAISDHTGHLRLSSRQHVSPIHELLNEFQHARAAGRLPPELRVEQIRKQVLLVSWLGEDLADLINQSDVEWRGRESMRWSGAQDGWLSEQLFRQATDADTRFQELFAATPLANASEEFLRQAVRLWMDRDLDDDANTTDLRTALMEALDQWPQPLTPGRGTLQQAKRRVADGLVLRVMLLRLENALSLLRPQLGLLEQHGLESARRVRDALLGYVPWSPSPLGPLGRRVVGFSFPRHAEEPGALNAQALCGDPHGLVQSLGDETALALCGYRRSVLGLSATAYFPGSPQYDVAGVLRFVEPDQSEGVIVAPAPVHDVDREGQPVRISGISAPSHRLTLVGRLTFLLWRQTLEQHLASLRADPHTTARPRVLLATGSYAECHAAAQGLARALGSPGEAQRRLRYVVPRLDGADSQAILPRDIEAFGRGEADILVAPLAAVARGHNIVCSDGRSAIASVFVLVRPVPPTDEAAGVLAHVSYASITRAHTGQSLAESLVEERRRAEAALYRLRRHTGPFGSMPADLRHAVLCDVLVDLAQLAGRCRRGGTDVRLFLVDGAFHDEQVGWDRLIAAAFAIWKADGVLSRMMLIHRSFLAALGQFAGIQEIRQP